MSSKESEKKYPIGTKKYCISICDHVLDNIYGQIGLTEVEKEIERLSIFKRLHNISQLGLVNWIFPCALHTRYTHSLGVMHVAGEMAMHINSNTTIETPFFDDDDIQIIRLAGLLHDIGHYPMSHNVEQAYKDASDSMSKKKASRLTPTQNLKTITKCPAFLDPFLLDTINDPHKDEPLLSDRESEKNKMLSNEEIYSKSFAGSTGFHHEYIGNLIITSNQSIHDTVKNHYILLHEDNQVVLNPKFTSSLVNNDEVNFVSENDIDRITTELLNAIGEIVRGNYENETYLKFPWLNKYSAMIQLIHSELDADNIDYLLRDATFSGTSYGTMDMSILLNCLTVSEFSTINGDEKTNYSRYIVGVKKKGIGCVEQFLLNKFLAYTQMILSKYVSILESMLLCFESDYVIKSESDNEYSCEGLKEMVKRRDPTSKYYSFSDHYIFQKIYSYKKNELSMKALPKAIVSQLNSLCAFNLDNSGQNEVLCTGFDDRDILTYFKSSELYNEFINLCTNLKKQEDELISSKVNSIEKEQKFDNEKFRLFPYRFESYSLTKQIPLEIFLNKFYFYEMSPERVFFFHYFRLADGIPILEKDKYFYDCSFTYNENPLESNNDSAHILDIPDLCVDSVQSCLHQIYPMKYVSLRHYKINEDEEL